MIHLKKNLQRGEEDFQKICAYSFLRDSISSHECEQLHLTRRQNQNAAILDSKQCSI